MNESHGNEIGDLVHWVTWTYEDRVQGVWGSTFWDLLFYDDAVLVLRNPKTLGMKWAAWVSDRARNRWIEAQKFRVEQLARSSPAKLLSRDSMNRAIVNGSVREARLVGSVGDSQLVLRPADGVDVSVFWMHGDGLGGIVSPNPAFDETESVLMELFGERFESSEGIGSGRLPSSDDQPAWSPPPPPPPPGPLARPQSSPPAWPPPFATPTPPPPPPPSEPSSPAWRLRPPVARSQQLPPPPPPPRSG